MPAATLLLIRHAAFDGIGEVLAGRTRYVGLNDGGTAQAERVARRVAQCPIAALYSSPMTRALQTSAVIASAVHCDVRVEPALDEVDFGDWTGRRVADLDGEAAWRAFNAHRTTAAVPGAGGMLDTQLRAVNWMLTAVARHAGGTVVAVSHADVIRALLAACAGLSLDLMTRFACHPASITQLHVGDGVPTVGCVNDTSHLG
jgi:probable phosphoglycerate mutase